MEGADDGQRGRGYPGVVGGFRQRRKGLFARLENGDAGLGSRVAGYFSGLHRRQAALRWVWRPSLISSMILALKASKSSGLHDALVDDDLGILAFRAGIGHVRLDRFIGGHLAALGDACFEPRRVADCSDHLLGIENVLDEF